MSAYTVNLKLYQSKPIPFFRKSQVILFKKSLLKKLSVLKPKNTYAFRVMLSVLFVGLIFLFHVVLAAKDESQKSAPPARHTVKKDSSKPTNAQVSVPIPSAGSLSTHQKDTPNSTSIQNVEKIPIMYVQPANPVSAANQTTPAASQQVASPTPIPTSSAPQPTNTPFPSTPPQQGIVRSLLDTTHGTLHDLLGK